MATTVPLVTKARKTFPIIMFTKMRNEGMSKKAACGMISGRENDGAYQQKHVKIILAIT
jgi:hypothetical protein